MQLSELSGGDLEKLYRRYEDVAWLFAQSRSANSVDSHLFNYQP